MTNDASTSVRLPLLRLGAVLLGVCAAGAGLGVWIGIARGVSIQPGLLTLGATIPGVLASLTLLALRPAQPAHAWALPVVAGTMVRAMVALLIALAVISTVSTDKPVFLLTVLGVLLACLAIEVGVVLSMIRAHGVDPQPTLHNRDRGQAHASLEGARS